jgi:3-dehydroquinate synthase
MTNTDINRISLDAKRSVSSDVVFLKNGLSDVSSELSQLAVGKSIVIFTNPVINKLYAEKLKTTLENDGFLVRVVEVLEGEKAKSLEIVSILLDSLLTYNLERNDTVIALGGGVIGDLSGFVASVYKRGCNFIQIPTSLLAQVDASIGGKTGVNHKSGKNLIGSFYQPRKVLIDISVLATLPQREMLCGLAEIIKYGVIGNPELFEIIEKNLESILRWDITADYELWKTLVSMSAKDKVDVVTQDELESGKRVILNFGHTIGHAVEAIYSYQKFLHGEAVAVGMKAAAYISEKSGICSEVDMKRLLSLLEACRFPLTIPRGDIAKMVSIMKQDKKVKDGKLRFVLMSSIGDVVIKDDVDEELIKDAIEFISGKQEVYNA